MKELRFKNRLQLSGTNLQIPWVEEIGFHRLVSPRKLTPHKHSGHEITFIFKGAVVWQTEEGDILTLAGGDMAIMPPNVLHWGKWEVISPCDICWIIFRPRELEKILLRNFDKNTAKQFIEGFVRTGTASIFAPVMAREKLAEIFTILQAWNSPGPLIRMNLFIKLLDFLVLAHSAFQAGGTKERIPVIPVKVERFIEENLDEVLLVKELAEKANMSISHFHASFKEKYGTTPIDYLQRKRCEKAVELLLEKDGSVTDIAYKLGFSSGSYFSRLFKKYSGMPPVKFQKSFSNRNNQDTAG